MSRYDKYDGMVGNFRAQLNFAIPDADVTKLFAVGLDANGKVVKGSGNTGVIGVLNVTRAQPVGAWVDVLKHGEVAEFAPTGGSPVAGTAYFGAANGDINTTGTGTYLGHTVEAQRLVVDVARVDAT